MPRLVASQMDRCVGCLLCVLASARERGAISLQDSAIKIKPEGRGFTAEIDAGAEVSPAVVKICPRNCLSLSDV